MHDDEIWRVVAQEERSSAEAHLSALVAGGAASIESIEALLLGDEREPFVAPRLYCEDRDLHYRLIELLGESGDPAFIPLLHRAFTDFSHFCSESSTKRALVALGFDADELPVESISILQREGRMFINEDPKYTGFSECPRCRFFPCRINEYYRKGIQDCSLYNRHDPAEQSELLDYRTSGAHVDEDASFRATEPRSAKFVPAPGGYASAEAACRDIPLLCDRILSTRKLADPLGWYHLHRCLEHLGETEEALIMLREAARWARLLPRSFAEARAGIADFDRRLSLLAVRRAQWNELENYRLTRLEREGQWEKAWRHYVRVNLANGEKTASSWFFVGDSHFALSELALAELFVKGSVLLSREGSQRRLFEERAEEIVAARRTGQELGFSLAQRSRS